MTAATTGEDGKAGTVFDGMANYMYLAIRLVAALVVVWYGSFSSR